MKKAFHKTKSILFKQLHVCNPIKCKTFSVFLISLQSATITFLCDFNKLL